MAALMKFLSGMIVICVYLCECKGGQFKSYKSVRTDDGSNLVEYLAFDKQSPNRCSVQCTNKPDCEAFAIKHDTCKLLKKSEVGETFIPENEEHLYIFNRNYEHAETTNAVGSTVSTVPSTTSANMVSSTTQASTTSTDTTAQTTTVGPTTTEFTTLPPVTSKAEEFPSVMTAGEIWGTNYILFATGQLFYIVDTVTLEFTEESEYSMSKFPQFTGNSVTAAIKIDDLLYLQDENANWKIYSVVITGGSFISATLTTNEITNPDVAGLVNLAAWIGSGAVFLSYDGNTKYKCIDKAYFTCKAEDCSGVSEGDWFECLYMVGKLEEQDMSATTVAMGFETDSQKLTLIVGKTLTAYSVG